MRMIRKLAVMAMVLAICAVGGASGAAAQTAAQGLDGEWMESGQECSAGNCIW
jgi:hypothetical protein